MEEGGGNNQQTPEQDLRFDVAILLTLFAHFQPLYPAKNPPRNARRRSRSCGASAH